MAARHVLMKQNFVTGAIYLGWARKEEIKHRQTVEEIIDFLEIAPIRKKVVGVYLMGCGRGSNWLEHWPWSRMSCFSMSRWQG